MTKEEIRAKYARVPTDFSEIEMLKDQLLDSGLLDVAQVDPAQAGKVLGILEDGSIGLVEGGTPSAPIVKGSVIKLNGEDYRVLSVNEDLTDCEVMLLGTIALSKFSNTSPTQDPSTAAIFTVNGVEAIGPKYEGSLLDQACEAFYDALPSDVKAAIIEQEIEQNMYNTSPAAGTEDFAIDNSAEGFDVYRFKKVNDAPVVVGTRHAYILSPKDIKDYFGRSSATGLEVVTIFQLLNWFKDASSIYNNSACILSYNYGQGARVEYNMYSNRYYICPAFHIDLTKVSL